MFIAHNYALVTGKSCGDKYEILSFDNALIDAKVGNYNLVRVSSILPPRCCVATDLTDLKKGSVLHIAYASLTKRGMGKIASAIAVGIPNDEDCVGVIMEYSNWGDATSCIEVVEEMVTAAMAKRGIGLKEIISTGCEIDVSKELYSTTFCGIALW